MDNEMIDNRWCDNPFSHRAVYDSADTLGPRVRYGAALGLLLASVCGVVDVLVITIWGHRTPYVLAPIVVLAYAMGGTLTGALLAALLHPRIPRHRAYPSPKRQRGAPPTGRGQFVHALSAACLLGGLSAFAVILLVRTVQGYQGYMAAPAAWLPVAAGLVVAVLVATGGAGRRRSVEPGAAVGILFFAALFCGLWEPVNKLYQAPMLSPAGLAAKAAYLAGGAVLYVALRAIIASMPGPRIRIRGFPLWSGPHGGPYGLDTTRRCATLALAVGAVGVLAGNATVWYRTPIPIDHQTPSSKRQRGAALRDKPNVILLVMDTAGANHLSTYGYSRKTTPHLTALAAEGVRYDRAIAPSSWTLASHASMFTGALPTEHRANLTVVSGKPKRVPLSNDYVTLAEVLSAAGYSTGAIVANTGFLSRELGIHQGFDYYDDAPRPTMAAAKPRTILPGMWICRWYQDRLPGWRRTWSRNAEEINAEVLAWLDRRPRQPLFLFVNYLDPHAPYNEHPEFRRRLGHGTEHTHGFESVGFGSSSTLSSSIQTDPAGDAARYDQEIAFLDARIGELLEALKLRGMYDNSLIIVTSDHGEAFGEHGWVGHGQLLYE
ncbi:MAG: sulfatase, partial [Phycisphaerae bacterium]